MFTKELREFIAARNGRWKDIVTYHLPMLAAVETARRCPPLFKTLPFQPRDATLNVTDNCCLRCITCNEWRQKSENELTTQEWKEVIQQLSEMGIQLVGMAGGEPLLRNDLATLVAYARDLGMDVSIVTNGYLLDERRAEELVEAGATAISLSVDALGETYDKIRGVKGAHKRVQAAAQILARLQERRGLQVTILATIMSLTLDHLPAVVEWTKSLNLPIVFNLIDYTPYFFQVKGNAQSLWIGEEDRPKLAQLVHWLTEMKSKHEGLIGSSYSDLEYVEQYFSDPLQKDLPCTAALVHLFIDSHGRVFGGCWSMGHFGDLRQSSLKEILSSKKYLAARRRMFFKECPGCSCGSETNLVYSVPHLVREMRLRSSYSNRSDKMRVVAGRT